MADLRIASLDLKHFSGLMDFAKIVHPGEADLADRVSWFSLGSPFLKEEDKLPALLALSEDKIIGQFMLNNQVWHFQDRIKEGFFGYDFFIKESYRKTGIGALLLIKAVRERSPFFGVGLTEAAERLYTAAKVERIGSLNKFLWPNRPFFCAAHILRRFIIRRGIREESATNGLFPQSIMMEGSNFELLPSFPAGEYKPDYDPETIEFSRSAEFLNWRFFESRNIRYYFYYCLSNNQPLYFVLRKVFRKGLNLLSLVDYKVSFRDPDALRLIIKCAKKITRDLKLDGLFTASSVNNFSRVMKDEGFISVGKPAPIVSTVGSMLSSGSPERKNAIYITMADADLDLNFGDN